MASIKTPIDAAGAVTAPTSADITLDSVNALLMEEGPLVSVAPIDGGRGVVLANGIDPLRLVRDDTVVRLGILAPRTAMTVTPSGTRATATLNLDVSTDGAYNPANNETADINGTITFVTSVTIGSGAPVGVQIVIGATAADTLVNLKAAIEGTGSGTTQYGWSAKLGSSWFNWAEGVSGQLGFADVTSISSTALTMRVREYGSSGNNYTAALGTGTWTDSSLGSSGYFSGGADGSGTAPDAGSYRHLYTRYRALDGAESGPSPSVLSEVADAQNLAIDAADQSEDTTSDYVWWYRTTTEAPLYYPGGKIARTDSPNDEDTDDVDDQTLTAFGAVPFDERQFRLYRDGFPPIVRYVATHNGMIFGGGAILAADKPVGTVAVTNDSYQVTFTAYMGPGAIGRTLTINGLSEQYTLVRRDSQFVFQLDRPYEGTTAGTASFSLRDGRDPYAVYFSVPGKPNQWPVENKITGIVGEDDEGVTGLVSYRGALIIFTRSSIYRLTGDTPETFDLSLAVSGIGCVSGHTVVAMDAGLMWLGRDGVYAWDGETTPTKVSSRPTDGSTADGIDGTVDRINRLHDELSHGHFDPEERVVRMFVPLDDAITPSHALTFDLGARCWSLDDALGVTLAATVSGADGSQVTLQGTDLGLLTHYGLGTSDGGYGSYEPVQTISSATTSVLTVSGTPLSGLDLHGLPVWVVYASGEVVLRKIASNTSGAVTLTQALDTAPAASDQFVIGGILLDLQTGRFDLGETYNEKVWKDAILSFSTQADGQLHFSTSVDQDALALPTQGSDSVDLTAAKGRSQIRVQKRGVLHGYRIACIEPGCEPTITRFEMILQTRDQGDM